MSDLQNVGVVTLYKAQEPRLDIQANRDFIGLMGAANISTVGYSCNSASTGQIAWSQTTPSVRNGVDRTVELDLTATITPVFSGGAANTYYRIRPMKGENGANQGVKAGLRAYPIHSICETVQCRLNDQTFSWEPAEQLHALLEYGLTQEERQYAMGSTPHYPDQQWRYTENTGNQRSVFSSYMNNTFEDGRNAGMWMNGGGSTGQAGTTQPSNVTVRLIEQMMLSPFVYGEEVQCFFGIQNIDVTLTLRQPLERMLCGTWVPNMIERSTDGVTWVDLTAADANLVFSPVFNFAQNDQKLHISYLSPQINQVIPWRLNYPYWQIQKFSQDVGVDVVAGDPNGFEVNYNNVTLHNIPKRMYLFAQPQLIQAQGNAVGQGVNYFGTPQQNDPAIASNVNQSQSDTFAALVDKGLTVNFDTQDGRFSTYDAYDVYKVCSSNGLKRSYKAWNEYVGSVICIEFGKDLNLNPLLCPGVRGNFQLSAQVRYRDIRNVGVTPDPENLTQTAPKRYRAYMIIVNTGIVTIQNQMITSSIGSLTEIQVEDAGWLKEGYRAHYRDIAGQGSARNIWSAIKSAAKKASPYVSPVADVIGQVAELSDDPRAKTASSVAKTIAKATKGRGRQSGGNGLIVGGKRASAHSLSRRM